MRIKNNHTKESRADGQFRLQKKVKNNSNILRESRKDIVFIKQELGVLKKNKEQERALINEEQRGTWVGQSVK